MVEQKRQRNVQKSEMHVQSCCIACKGPVYMEVGDPR